MVLGIWKYHGETRLPSKLRLIFSGFPYLQEPAHWPGIWYFRLLCHWSPLGPWKIWKSWLRKVRREFLSLWTWWLTTVPVITSGSKSFSGSRWPFMRITYFIEVTKNPTTGRVTWGSVWGAGSWHQQVPSSFFPQGPARSQLAKSCLARRNLQDDQWWLDKGIAGFGLMPSSILKDLEWRSLIRP